MFSACFCGSDAVRMEFGAAIFTGFGLLLRNNATGGGGSFFSSLCKRGGGAVVGAVLGGMIADVPFEVRVDEESIEIGFDVLFRAWLDEKTGVLAAEGAVGEPGVARHGNDKIPFYVVGRLLDLEVALEHGIKEAQAFAGEDAELAGESMFGCILSDLGFGLGRLRTRTFLCIGAIGLEFTF